MHTGRRGKIIRAFDDYLSRGGFPEVVGQECDRDKRNLLQNYYKTIFYKDIVDRYGIRAKHVLDSMMDYCLNTYSELFSVSKF